MKIIEEHIAQEIKLLCRTRLKGTVDFYQVLKWLSNFEVSEYDTALSVLFKLEVFTEKEIVELWDERLKSLLKEHGADREYILYPFGDFGKSGTMMTYYIKKAPSFKIKYKALIGRKKNIFCRLTNNKKSNRNVFRFIGNHQKSNLSTLPENSFLIFVDDFIGSGKTFYDYYNDNVCDTVSENISVGLLSLISMSKGLEKIKSILPPENIFMEEKIPAFSSRNSVFGYRPKMIKIRDFCYKYGAKIFPKEKNKISRLGYDNTQSLVCFPYNTPNNTIPIIWSSKNLPNQKKWYPLYPRFSEQKISEAKGIRKELSFELAQMITSPIMMRIFYSGNEKKGDNIYHYFMKTDFLKFSILRLLKKRRSKKTICQILGITESDFKALIDELNVFNILNIEDLSFTKNGEMIYFAILRVLKKLERNSKFDKKELKFHEIDYLPEEFNGKS